MAEALQPLPPVDGLYDYRLSDGGVPEWLPYNQGDVFQNVEILGGPENTEKLAMLFMHPCTMRDSKGLREFVTVISVIQVSPKKVLGEESWEKKYKVMPLPDLKGDGKSSHCGDFMTMGTVRSSDLPRECRIAQLSSLGRLHLLQRVIYHLTRHAPKTSEIETATAAVEIELQHQADWLESVSNNRDLSADDVANLEIEFQRYLDEPVEQGGEIEGGITIRKLLTSDRAAAVRRIQRDIQSGLPGKLL